VCYQHECGFALWPTKASSGGFNYSYHTESDIVRQFVQVKSTQRSLLLIP